MWCIADLDNNYIEHMEEVLEVYEKPLSAEEPVVCVDEKPVTLHDEVRDPIPMKPGSVAKRDSEYERCGTANVFCGIEPRAGVHFTKVTPTRASPEFADFIQSIANRYPLRYWLRLSPLPGRMKQMVSGVADRLGLGGMRIGVNVGNLLSIGRKSNGASTDGRA